MLSPDYVEEAGNVVFQADVIEYGRVSLGIEFGQNVDVAGPLAAPLTGEYP